VLLTAPGAAVPPPGNWLPVLIPVILALAGGGGFVAWRRLRTESPRIIVEAAQGAVIVQSGVIDDLQDGLERARSEVRDLRAELAEALKLQRRVRELEHREEELKAENTRLKAQVRDLQHRLTDLEGRTGK
jgi:FtsZ-binding cell division protein ZapB